MSKQTNKQKPTKVVKSVRFSQEDIDLMEKGAEVKGMSVSDFIVYCVRKEFIGKDLISPDEIDELNKQSELLFQLAETLRTTTQNLNRKTDYQLTDKLKNIVTKEEEAIFQSNLKSWFETAKSSIEFSINPVSLSKELIKQGIYEYNLTDYAVSILENAADKTIQIRR